MADLEKTVSIIFQGKDTLSDSVSKIEGKVNSFARNTQKITQPLSDIATSILEIDAAMNTLLAGGLAYATKKAGEFGDSFAEISTLIDASAQNIGIFKNDILDYSTDSTKSLDDINAAVYTAISAGTDYQESLALTSEAEKLAVSSKAELEPTVRLLASTMNAYGASADEAQKYSDVFFQTVRLGQTTLPELAQTLANVSNISANAKVPIETLSAAIAAITAKGAPTAQAITSIKGAISNIIKPSAQAREEAEKLGIQFDAQALASKGLDGVLLDLMEATRGNVDEIAKFFDSTKALSGVLSLAGDGGEKFTSILADMRNATGSTDIAYGKMADNFGLANQKLVNNFNATIIKIGDKIIGKYGDVVGALTDATRVIGAGIDSSTFDPIWAMLNEFGDELVKGFNDIRDNLPDALKLVDVGPLVDSYINLGGAIKDAIQAIFGEIDLTTPKGLSDAINKIVDTISTLNNVTTGIIRGLKPFLELVGEGIEKFQDMDAATADVVGKILGFATGLNKILDHSKAITGFFAALAGSTMANAILNITKLGASVLGLTPALSLLGPAAIAAGAGAGVVLLVDKLTEELAPAVNDTIDYFDDLAASVFGYQSASQKAAEEQRKFAEELLHADDVLSEIEASINEMDKALGTPETGATAEAWSTALDEWGMTQKGWEKINGAWINVKYKAEIDELSVTEVIEKIDEIPEEKKIEPVIDQKAVENEIEKIKAQAEIVATSLEWKAKLDIAEVEAATEDLKTIFGSIDTAITSTGDLIGDLYGKLSNPELDILSKASIQSALRSEENRRTETFELQKKLTEQQIKLNDLRLEALERGDAMITIDGAGLQPHLEAFMWEILEAIQIRANSEGAEFLLGV